MTLINELQNYFDQTHPSLYVHGSRSKIWQSYIQAKHEEIDDLDRFIQIVENKDIPECTFLHFKALILRLKKKGFETSRTIESIRYKPYKHRDPLKFDWNLNDIILHVRAQSDLVGCVSALALCGLKPQEMLQIQRIDGDTIYFTNPSMPNRIVPSCFQSLVDELVADDILNELMLVMVSTGDPRLDRANITRRFTDLRASGQFPYTLGQLRYTGAVICLVNEGLDAVDDVAEMLNITVQSARNALYRWVENNNISKETAKKIKCQH